jgi:hypothetical protein
LEDAVHVAFNLVLLYAAWFAAVLAAAGNRPWTAAAASLVVLSINIALAPRRSAEIKLVFQAALIGLVLDGLLINLGFARYAAPGPILELPPPWLVLIWMVFATAINASLAWLKPRLALSAMLGLLGGPFSYFSGSRLGAMEFSEPVWQGLCMVGVLWAIAFPLLLFLASQSSGEAGSDR